MPFEIIHFRDAEKILRGKKMLKHVRETLECVHKDLYERFYKGNILRQTLDHMGWRNDTESMRVIPGRRYSYKGLKNRVAIDANLQNYEFILEGCARLQISYDHGRLDTGILLLNGWRSEKSTLPENVDVLHHEMEELYPTISMPVTVVLYDLGKPKCIDPDGKEQTTPSTSNGGTDRNNNDSTDEEVNVYE